MGIETLLDIMSITLQDKRERNQDSLSKQSANTTPPFVKGKKPQVLSTWTQQIQKFKDQMKMPKGTENVKTTQL